MFCQLLNSCYPGGKIWWTKAFPCHGLRRSDLDFAAAKGDWTGTVSGSAAVDFFDGDDSKARREGLHVEAKFAILSGGVPEMRSVSGVASWQYSAGPVKLEGIVDVNMPCAMDSERPMISGGGERSRMSLAVDDDNLVIEDGTAELSVRCPGGDAVTVQGKAPRAKTGPRCQSSFPPHSIKND